VAIERLRIHVAVAHGGQRLDAEKEAIEEPMSARAAGDSARLEAVKRGEKKVQRDVNADGKRGELWPPQTKQPAINVAPSPRVGVDFDKLDLTGADGNAIGLSQHVHLIFGYG
jgi:hypothetical protein